MTRLEDYRHAFKYIRLERQDGVLEMTIHRDGGSARWDFGPTGIHRELGDAFQVVGRDPDTRAMILTGAGEVFLTELDFGDMPAAIDAAFLDRLYGEGKALLHSLLDLEFPVIAAVNGDAFVHAELAVLSDIVLAAEHARFADKAHFVSGAVPGDGVHVVWPMLLGPNRGRYFLLIGEELDAQEAKRLGVVGEVLPAEALMPRARELARQIAAKPRALTRYTRLLLTQDLKRRMLAELSHGLMLENMASLVR